jgi:excisionase family DNA binding protein
MTDEHYPSPDGDPPAGGGACGISGALPVPEIVRLLALALSAHVRRHHQEGLFVPREVEELTAFLVRLARMRQDASSSAKEHAVAHYAPVPERLLVTKGEAAERLGVSVRTIERLVATGRLRQVHVERLARFRVSDLEAYVDSLDEGDAPDADSGNHDDHP